MTSNVEVIALSGGVGGAKLVSGLAKTLDPTRLLVIANTGDDFVHMGLHVSPDIDSIVYVTTGRNNPVQGWGRADETWNFMEMIAECGGETWFRLGDGDLALHVLRSDWLRQGKSLSAVTCDLAAALGVPFRLLPMSDDRVGTIVESDAGPLPLQSYFVREQCRPKATGFTYQGADQALAQPQFLEALQDPALRAVVICPSNPYLSIDPILVLPDVREALSATRAPIIAVSPIVGGQALKGPTAKIMAELGLEPSAATIANHYGDLIDGFLLHETDSAERDQVRDREVEIRSAPIVMKSPQDQAALAREVMRLADELQPA